MPEQAMDGAALVWVAGYLCLNIGITVSNKALLAGWHHPEALALWHFVITATGSTLAVRVFRVVEPERLSWDVLARLALFSLLFNANILMSNVSMDLVSLASHQIIRALAPAFTVAISFLLQGRRQSSRVLLSLLLVFAGVCMCTIKGKLSASPSGLCLTTLGALLSSLKGVVANIFMVRAGLSFHPLDLVHYMASFAALQLLLYLLYTGALAEAMGELALSRLVPMLLGNGALALLLNVTSLTANRASTPLLLNVATTFKKILLIAIGVLTAGGGGLDLASGGGLALTCAGIVWYAHEEYRGTAEKRTEAAGAEKKDA